MRKLWILILVISLVSDFSHAATSSPSPTSAGKATGKAIGSKATPKKTYKKYVRKRVKPIPSPSPKWPPANFTNSGLVYAKIPSAEELKSYASGSVDITIGLKDCEKFTCGAVFLASEAGCNWWQIDSMVTGTGKGDLASKETLGTLKTIANGSRPKKIIAVLLKSTEPIQQGVTVSGITARCWATEKPDRIPSNTYTPTLSGTATPTN